MQELILFFFYFFFAIILSVQIYTSMAQPHFIYDFKLFMLMTHSILFYNLFLPYIWFMHKIVNYGRGVTLRLPAA